jgi:hypothetical protein
LRNIRKIGFGTKGFGFIIKVICVVLVHDEFPIRGII